MFQKLCKDLPCNQPKPAHLQKPKRKITYDIPDDETEDDESVNCMEAMTTEKKKQCKSIY